MARNYNIIQNKPTSILAFQRSLFFLPVVFLYSECAVCTFKIRSLLTEYVITLIKKSLLMLGISGY